MLLESEYLVTTAHPQTFPIESKHKVLFLGEWCKVYNKKNIWQKLDFRVAPYHWDDREKLSTDYVAIQVTHEKCLTSLVIQLNQFHHVNYSKRYWRILIGPWLGYFLQMLFDRWSMLKQVLDGKKYRCSIIKREALPLVSKDMNEFIQLFQEDDWNEVIYGQLIQIFWNGSVDIFWVDGVSTEKSQITTENSLKTVIKKSLTFLSRSFSRDNDYFFISSYLPLKVEMKLQMQLLQVPSIWFSQSTPDMGVDAKQRQWILDMEIDNDFDKVAQAMIPLHIPIAYLEGYKALNISADKLHWIKNPKAIYTSNSYSSDDMFKVWAATKVELGVPLIIGQHGGSYGINSFIFVEDHQVKISDKWISWGWKDSHRSNIVAVGNLKIIEKKVTHDPHGGILMIENAIPRYSYSLYAAPIAGQWLNYFNEQVDFLSELKIHLRKHVLVRLNLSFNDAWGQSDRWKDIMPEVAIDPGIKNLEKLIRNSRVCIITYNATTYLESLAWNIPTIIFWNPSHWELSEQSKPYFKALELAGIFHKTPVSAARQLENIWSDVENWWKSNKVQEARIAFVDNYSASSKETFSLLKKHLKD